MMKNLSEKGQAIVMVAFAVIGLVAFAALAIDGGRLFSDKRHAQNAADSAAMAVALAIARNPGFSTPEELESYVEDIGEESAALNGYDDNGVSNEVTVELVRSPKKSCTYHGWDAEVMIVSNIDTTLARVVGRQQLSNTVSAWARYCDPVILNGVVEKEANISLLK
jgi:hypothetical protein